VLGECSYGIYLLHGIILNLLFVDAFWVMSPVPTDYLPVALPIIAICLAFVTSFTYLVVERPMIRAGSFLAKQWTGRRLRANVLELEVAP
jgi:peptidoglycan/LPS O-acetylase OafA/YrhL